VPGIVGTYLLDIDLGKVDHDFTGVIPADVSGQSGRSVGYSIEGPDTSGRAERRRSRDSRAMKAPHAAAPIPPSLTVAWTDSIGLTVRLGAGPSGSAPANGPSARGATAPDLGPVRAKTGG
jgi:hypothetical protein